MLKDCFIICSLVNKSHEIYESSCNLQTQVIPSGIISRVDQYRKIQSS